RRAGGEAGEDRVVLDGDVPRERHAVREDDVITDAAVVAPVAVIHEEIVAADRGRETAAQGSDADRRELAHLVAVAEREPTLLAAVLQILGQAADLSVRIEAVPGSERRRAVHARIAHDGGEMGRV